MQKKSEIFKKRNFLVQPFDFLPHRKPGLYISRVDFFFFEYHEFSKINKYGRQPKTIPIKMESKISASEAKGQDLDYRQVDRQ